MVNSAAFRDPRLGWGVVAALLVVVVLEGVLRTLTRLFVLNFDIAGPNATMGLVGLLCTGWTLLVVARIEPSSRTVFLVCGMGLLTGFVGSLAAAPLLAAVGAVLAVTAATPPLAGLCVHHREWAVGAVATGFLLDIGVRTALVTASPYGTSVGGAGLAAVTLAAGGALLGSALADRTPALDWEELGPTPAPLFVLLLVGAGYLAQPWTAARWALGSFPLAVLALIVGVVAGLVVTTRSVGGRVGIAALSGLYLASTAVLLWGGVRLTVLALAPAWASALALLGAAVANTSEQRGRVWATLAGQGLVVVGLVLATVATHWAFMPPGLAVLRDTTAEVLFATHAVVVVAVGVAVAGTPSEEVDQSRRSALAASLGAVAPVGGLGVGRTAPGNSENGDGIRVMAYNVHLFLGTDGTHSLRALRETIAESGADIVALCESDAMRPTAGHVDGVRWLGAKLGYHTAFGAPTRAQSYGVALLSRWPITDVEVVELPIERSLTRVAVVGRVQTPNGDLPVVGTHLSVGGGEGKREQIRRVADQVQQFDQAVVLGDFNVTPTDPENEELDTRFSDAWATAGHTTGPGGTYPADDPETRIDYVLLHGMTARSATTTGTGSASDHRAVVADIEFEE